MNWWRRFLALCLLVGLISPNLEKFVKAQSGHVPSSKNQVEQKKKDVPVSTLPEVEKKGTLRGGHRPPTKKPRNDEPTGDPIQIETNLVNLEVVVRHKKSGMVFRNLKKENFILLEDGIAQEISSFRPVESPITLVMLLEYNRVIVPIQMEVIQSAATFVANFVKPEDYVSVVTYDMRQKVLNDFTNDSAELSSSINLLLRGVPTFRESNLYDAVKFVVQGGKLDNEEYVGLQEVQGRTAVLLIGLGIDTFSKINYDQVRKLIEGAGIPIYCVGIGNFFYKLNDVNMSSEQSMTFLQAFNTLKTFSDISGGKYFPVTFSGELPSTLGAINALMRSQYSLGYYPTNTRHQGKRRKIELLIDINNDGKADNKELEIQYRKSYLEPAK